MPREMKRPRTCRILFSIVLEIDGAKLGKDCIWISICSHDGESMFIKSSLFDLKIGKVTFACKSRPS